jgi:hypothetical protein
MKTNKYKLSASRRKLMVALIAAISLISSSLLAGCGSVSSAASPARAPEPVNTIAATETNLSNEEHPISMDPEELPAAEETNTPEGYGAKGALADQDLSIADMLLYAIQDEYLAHGEYTAIISEFGSQNPYANIVRSEETHIALLKEVFDAYGFEIPADDSEEHLIVPGSLLEAAQTGVQAEIDNIAMYEKFLSYDLPDDIADAFTALKTASESHLLAFQKQVEKLQ